MAELPFVDRMVMCNASEGTIITKNNLLYRLTQSHICFHNIADLMWVRGTLLHGKFEELGSMVGFVIEWPPVSASSDELLGGGVYYDHAAWRAQYDAAGRTLKALSAQICLITSKGGGPFIDKQITVTGPLGMSIGGDGG